MVFSEAFLDLCPALVYQRGFRFGRGLKGRPWLHGRGFAPRRSGVSALWDILDGLQGHEGLRAGRMNVT
jgi:hypothetical protein